MNNKLDTKARIKLLCIEELLENSINDIENLNVCDVTDDIMSALLKAQERMQSAVNAIEWAVTATDKDARAETYNTERIYERKNSDGVTLSRTGDRRNK